MGDELSFNLTRLQDWSHLKVNAYLLELSAAHETIGIVLRTGGPANAVIRIEVDASLALILVEKLETVIVDENVGASALKFVSRDGGFDRLDRRRDDRRETLLVHWALDRDVRQCVRGESVWEHGGVETAILLHLLDGSDALSDATDDDLSEELLILLAWDVHKAGHGAYQREEDLNGREREEGQTSVVVVDGNLNGDLAEPSAQHDGNQDQCEGDQDSV